MFEKDILEKMRKNAPPALSDELTRAVIIKEIEEALAAILTKYGIPYTPHEITLNYLQKTDDPWFSALGVLNAPGVKNALEEINGLLYAQTELLKQMAENHGAILSYIQEIEALAPIENNPEKEKPAENSTSP